MQQTASKKVVNAWAMYDWANSAYNLVITTTIFPEYFAAITGDDNPATLDTVQFLGRTFRSDSLYSYSLSFAFLIVALASPLLSSIADTRGNKKHFLAFFMTMGSIACCSLYFFTSERLGLGIFCMIIACIGYWSSLVFYNSYLPEIAAPQDRDRISAKGFAFGYIGSVLLQLICFLFVLKHDWFGFADTGAGSRFSFLATGIWWFLFALVPLYRLPRYSMTLIDPNRGAVFNGYVELRKVWQQLKQLPPLRRFLGAYFFYNMGVQTVMLAATLYAKSELQIPTANLIIALVLIQLIAVPGAFAISKLSEKVGNIRALMIVVAIWIGLCVAGYMAPVGGVVYFYLLAAAIGFVMGGIQSLSRSTYAKLMPDTKDTTSFFSFFDVTEKIANVVGLFAFGYISELTGTQRNSVLALVVYFIIGLLNLFYTLRTKPKTDYPATA